jgi:hypothetical protein
VNRLGHQLTANDPLLSTTPAALTSSFPDAASLTTDGAATVCFEVAACETIFVVIVKLA